MIFTESICGMRCINLHEDTINILRIHYSYNKQLEHDENFIKFIGKIENVLKVWRTGNLSLKRKLQFSNDWLYLK